MKQSSSYVNRASQPNANLNQSISELSASSNHRLDDSYHRQEINPENYLRMQNTSDFSNSVKKHSQHDDFDFDQVMVPGSNANNNQIDIHQNMHPFNSANRGDKYKLSKSNYTKIEDYKPFDIANKIDYINDEERMRITYCTFNQDNTCLALGTEKHGFSIYQVSPLCKVYQSKQPEEAEEGIEPEENMIVVCVEMQFTSNILALVQTTQEQASEDAESSRTSMKGLGTNQPVVTGIEDGGHYTSGMVTKNKRDLQDKEARRRRRRCKLSKRELVIFDTTRQEAIMTVKFFQKIIGIKMNLKHIITISKDKVYIHDLEGMSFVQKLDLQFHMSRVVLSPNISRNKPLLFFSDSTENGILSTYNIERNKVMKKIMAHNTAILKIACDLEGHVVATNSAHGDVIRLWSSETGVKLATFRQQPNAELSALAIGQSGIVTTFTVNGHFQTYTMPEEAKEFIHSSSQHSFQVSSFQESDFLDSNEMFGDLEETESLKGKKKEKEIYTSFCQHIKQSFSDLCKARKPDYEMTVTFDEYQEDQPKTQVICGSSHDGMKIFAFDQVTGQMVSILYQDDMLRFGSKNHKPIIEYQCIYKAPSQVIPRVARLTETARNNKYQSITPSD